MEVGQFYVDESQYEPPLVKEQLFFPFLDEKTLNRKEIKNDVLKLRRRSEQQAATVWINFISDFCCG